MAVSSPHRGCRGIWWWPGCWTGRNAGHDLLYTEHEMQALNNNLNGEGTPPGHTAPASSALRSARWCHFWSQAVQPAGRPTGGSWTARQKLGICCPEYRSIFAPPRDFTRASGTPLIVCLDSSVGGPLNEIYGAKFLFWAETTMVRRKPAALTALIAPAGLSSWPTWPSLKAVTT